MSLPRSPRMDICPPRTIAYIYNPKGNMLRKFNQFVRRTFAVFKLVLKRVQFRIGFIFGNSGMKFMFGNSGLNLWS
jgi:hypothetical protein